MELDPNDRNNMHSDSDNGSSSEETKLLHKEKESVVQKKKYPKSVFFIIGNEFCERFSYYGLRTVLTIYLTERLFYSENSATVIYHLFTMLAYFSPLLGAIIADSFLGKFRTILYVSILYACGGIILSLGAFPNPISTMTIISLVGLFVIALGTGGIKPCVSAFGGDQFREGQEKQLQKFFSLFYLSINAGSLLSTFLTPILREDVHCLGEKSCFPIAFGVPAVLMIIALLLFVCGKPFYIIKPPEGNIVLKVAKCVCYAVSKKCKSSEKKRAHWLDYADDKFDKNLIGDIKTLFHVFVLYIPLPVFWALFDQQGSRWTLQARRMDGLVGGFHIKADQMQVINPLLIVAFIPLFDYIVYPLLSKCRLLRTPLQRITTGGILAAISFVVAGLIELKLETALPMMPNDGYSQLTIINNSPCDIRINNVNLDVIKAFETTVKNDMILEKDYSWDFTPESCSVQKRAVNYSFNSTKSIESMMITIQNNEIVIVKGEDTKEKSHTGEPKLRIFYSIDPLTLIQTNETKNVTFKIVSEKYDSTYFIKAPSPNAFGMTGYGEFPPGRYKIYAPSNETAYLDVPAILEEFNSGGVYIVSIYNRKSEDRKNSFMYEMVKGNFLSILFQIPQYIIITAGEIMFSITGLEFSYSQSPTSMKSVVQAAWLLTVAVGNLLVLIIAKLKLFERQSGELFLFATIMGVDMIIFAVLAFFYKYVNVKNGDSEQIDTTSKGKSNEAYVEETDFNK